ncbi:MAG: hypothetical protein JW395_0503 [Nitrospira sp.]|nr:hypothetical protein [Nitrospira sp.]
MRATQGIFLRYTCDGKWLARKSSQQHIMVGYLTCLNLGDISSKFVFTRCRKICLVSHPRVFVPLRCENAFPADRFKASPDATDSSEKIDETECSTGRERAAPKYKRALLGSHYLILLNTTQFCQEVVLPLRHRTEINLGISTDIGEISPRSRKPPALSPTPRPYVQLASFRNYARSLWALLTHPPRTPQIQLIPRRRVSLRPCASASLAFPHPRSKAESRSSPA